MDQTELLDFHHFRRTFFQKHETLVIKHPGPTPTGVRRVHRTTHGVLVRTNGLRGVYSHVSVLSHSPGRLDGRKRSGTFPISARGTSPRRKPPTSVVTRRSKRLLFSPATSPFGVPGPGLEHSGGLQRGTNDLIGHWRRDPRGDSRGLRRQRPLDSAEKDHPLRPTPSTPEPEEKDLGPKRVRYRRPMLDSDLLVFSENSVYRRGGRDPSSTSGRVRGVPKHVYSSRDFT